MWIHGDVVVAFEQLVETFFFSFFFLLKLLHGLETGLSLGKQGKQPVLG